MTLLLIYAFLAIFFSFLCSILEAVLLSVTPTFVNVSKEQKKPFANGLEKLKKDVDRPLIAILTLNTIAHTVGAILVGNQAAHVWGGEASGGHGGSLTDPVGIVSAIMTLAVLVVSEIIPKTIGATYWKQLAGFSTKTLQFMVGVMKYTGLLWLMKQITKLFGSSEHESVFSRADFSAMASAAEKSGELEGGESAIIKNLMQLSKLTVNDIMTPRLVMKTANEDTHIQNFYKSNKELRFSRIPIYDGSSEIITGYVLKDEVLENMVEGNGATSLKEIRRPILSVKTNDQLDVLFNSLTKDNEHIAIVTDDYNSVVGLVTMEDVVETLLGTEIVDELDNIEDLQKLARYRWEERAKSRGLLDNS